MTDRCYENEERRELCRRENRLVAQVIELCLSYPLRDHARLLRFHVFLRRRRRLRLRPHRHHSLATGLALTLVRETPVNPDG